MPEMRHLLSPDSILVLRAAQAQMEDPEVVDNMTRTDLHTHLAIRSQLGASDEEIFAKVERWDSMRDALALLRRAKAVKAQREADKEREEQERFAETARALVAEGWRP